MGKLDHKIAIVTGGGLGTAAAICRKFAAEGAKVLVCGFPDDPVEDVVADIVSSGGIAMSYKGDISSEIKAKECVTIAINNWGKVDIFVSASGVFPGIEEMDVYPIEAFYYMMRNNIQSAFMMTRFVLPELQKTSGSMVFTGSESGISGIPGNVPYGGTKGFIHAFARGLALEQAKFGIRVNCVFNGPMDISWLSSTKSKNLRFSESNTMQWKLSPEELADDYLFLVSSESVNYNGILYSSKDHTIKEVKATNRKFSALKNLFRPTAMKSRRRELARRKFSAK